MSEEASGLIGGRLVFSKRKSGRQARFQRAQKDAKSFEQIVNRDVYKDAIAEWQLLSQAEKNYWDNLAKGRDLTGWNLFVKDYYMNTIKKLATVENIDFMALGDTVLYTVPVGMKVIVTGFNVRTKTIDATAGDGQGMIKRGSDDRKIWSFDAAEIDEVGTCLFFSIITMLPGHNYGWQAIVPAGDTVEIEIITADTGTGLTVDVDLIGYLIPA